MKGFNNIKIATKLIGGFGSVAILLVVVGVLGYLNMKNINDGMTTLFFDRTVPIGQLGTVNMKESDLRGDLNRMISFPEEFSKLEQNLNANIKIMNDQMDLYRASQLDAEEKVQLAKFDQDWPGLQQAITEIIAKVKANDLKAAKELMKEGSTESLLYTQVETELNKLLEINVRVADEVNKAGDITFANSTLTILVVSVVAVLIAIVLALLITNSINQPLKIMSGALQNMQNGDLNRDMSQDTKDVISERADEIGIAGKGLRATESYLLDMAAIADQIASGNLTVNVTPHSAKDELGTAFAKMITSLRTSVGQVAESARNVSAASMQLSNAANQAGQAVTQIATTIQQVAKGTAQQTEGITRTAHSVEEMARAIDGVAKGAQEQAQAVAQSSTITTQLSKAIQQVAGNAQAVSRDSNTAAQAARSGAVTVEDTIKGMQSIKQKVGVSTQKVQEMGIRSEEIGTIVVAIEDIASQTNLLALNAAIEAARAGEHGKGFSVVADEVRKLAERASSATKEIGGLIKGIQKTVAEAVKAMEEGDREVESGVVYANQAGQVLKDILVAAEAVNQQAEQAAAASEQMSASADELVKAVDSVSAVVEENTASTEEMAAGSSEVTHAIENVASISEENSAAAEEVSASAEEMSAQVEEVSASAQSLSEMAEMLQKVVAQFKL
ncbi:MAG: methyl-accepting chemotaxis protein [Chloroflexota bacterium]